MKELEIKTVGAPVLREKAIEIVKEYKYIPINDI